ncbi:unnamed protein product [Diamesa serratosioi]
MPIALIRSISLPNLKLYATVSLLLVSICIYYSFNVVTADPHWRLKSNTTSTGIQNVLKSQNDGVSSVTSLLINTDLLVSLLPRYDNVDYNKTNSFTAQLNNVVSFMSQEPVCIWTLINMAYCCLILVGKSIQKIVFGELRISEQQHMKDKFWNFIFYKFIFVFGVVNVQYLHEVVIWVAWFTALGFLHLLAQLCKDRFEYLSFSPTTPGWSHFRIIALLSSIFTMSSIMIIVSIYFGIYNGINTFAFMGAECLILVIRTLHVLIRYGMFLYDMRQGAINTECKANIIGVAFSKLILNFFVAISWDKRGPVAYYTEFGFDCGALLVDLSHHLHMLLWSNIFLSMASLVIIMQLRYLANEIQRKFKKHRKYRWVLNHMEKNYPIATAIDLAENSDNCAICWEKMETARKLPCSHIFHNSCLQSWLEQDTSCPTCRLALSVQSSNSQPPNRTGVIDLNQLGQMTDGGGTGNLNIPGGQNTAGAQNNHFFHFNGSRYVSWLPNFSVEVSNFNNVLRNATINHMQLQQQTSQIKNMARHIQEMFPRYPISTLIADLQITHSIEITIDNILEERLQVPRIPIFEAEEQTNNTNNTPGSYLELLRDDNPESQPQEHFSIPASYNSSYLSLQHLPLGEHFSKSSKEREQNLQKRKEKMLVLARKRFLEKTRSDLIIPTTRSSLELRHRNGGINVDDI